MLLSTKVTKEIQMICCSALTVPLGWCLFWLSNDILVWHKSILQSNMTNLVGIVACAMVIFASVKFDLIDILLGSISQSKKPQKPDRTDVVTKLEKPIVTKSEHAKDLGHTIGQSNPSQPLRTTNQPKIAPQVEVIPQVEDSKSVVEPTIAQSCPARDCDCLAFLQQRVKSAEIPNECLTCDKLLDCISKTAKK